MVPLIAIENLSRIYKLDSVQVAALREVNLQINQGEMVSITGPSGCGKSTLMHLLGLLDSPTSGKIYFGGKDVSRFSEEERASFRSQEVGFVFQQFNLLKKFTSLENVLLPVIYSKTKSDASSRGRRLLREVGLEHRMSHLTSKLSGGEQQRVAIARALINDPSLILADEPTGNLDSRAGAEILNLLKDLNKGGRTLVMVTHDPNVAGSCQRVIRMKDGEVVE